MEDSQIIDLYWKRDENAIRETDRKYGAFCHKIAMNLLSVHEDAEECVNDTFYQAWNQMPPKRPDRLKAWLGRIVRNISINLWNKNHAQKRYGGMEQIFDELEDCIPSPKSVEHEIEEEELGECISEWLLSLSRDDRILFVRRYWYGCALNDLADERGIVPGNLAKKMYRLRLGLKEALDKEGIYL